MDCMNKAFLEITVSPLQEQRFHWVYTNHRADFGKTKLAAPQHFGTLLCHGSANNSPDCPDWSNEVLDLVANEVKPDFIRVEADEVTYNLHIMIRYEIEKMIFNGGLKVEDIPATWNKMMQDWFGIEVPGDSLGCLQDIHWSMGAFGYFPTYTLGNLYAAQLLQTMSEELGDIDEIIKSGDWSGMLIWLREKIHAKGSVMTPSELIESATGSPPSPEPFLNYVEAKYSKLYNL